MQAKISQALSAQACEVLDASGDARHVSIKVVSKAFEGVTAVNRQRMVYKCITEELLENVHAVNSMVTQTPEEAASK